MNINDIKVGTRLEIELLNNTDEKVGQTYISQIVDIIDDSTLLVAAPIHESRLSLIPTGTKIRLVFSHERYGLLSFDGIIDKKDKIAYMVTFQVTAVSGIVQIQRRQFFRLDCILNSKYAVLPETRKTSGDNNTGETNDVLEYREAITKNISGSGASIIAGEDIPSGTVIKLVISIKKDVTITAVCLVVRNSLIQISGVAKYNLGLYFKDIPLQDQQILIKYIYDQQRKLLKNSLETK